MAASGSLSFSPSMMALNAYLQQLAEILKTLPEQIFKINPKNIDIGSYKASQRIFNEPLQLVASVWIDQAKKALSAAPKKTEAQLKHLLAIGDNLVTLLPDDESFEKMEDKILCLMGCFRRGIKEKDYDDYTRLAHAWQTRGHNASLRSDAKAALSCYKKAFNYYLNAQKCEERNAIYWDLFLNQAFKAEVEVDQLRNVRLAIQSLESACNYYHNFKNPTAEHVGTYQHYCLKLAGYYHQVRDQVKMRRFLNEPARAASNEASKQSEKETLPKRAMSYGASKRTGDKALPEMKQIATAQLFAQGRKTTKINNVAPAQSAPSLKQPITPWFDNFDTRARASAVFFQPARRNATAVYNMRPVQDTNTPPPAFFGIDPYL